MSKQNVSENELFNMLSAQVCMYVCSCVCVHVCVCVCVCVSVRLCLCEHAIYVSVMYCKSYYCLPHEHFQIFSHSKFCTDIYN